MGEPILRMDEIRAEVQTISEVLQREELQIAFSAPSGRKLRCAGRPVILLPLPKSDSGLVRVGERAGRQFDVSWEEVEGRYANRTEVEIVVSTEQATSRPYAIDLTDERWAMIRDGARGRAADTG